MQKSFIIIKGQPKALQIETIYLESSGSYAVKFDNSPQTYHYRWSDVVIIKEAKAYAPEACHVFVEGMQKHNIVEILCFTQGSRKHWRITYTNGFKRDFVDGNGIEVKENCLADATARNVFEYLKSIARTNSLGRDEESQGILTSQYNKIDFIDKALAIGPYLYPANIKVGASSTPPLIYPFGCNASQKAAVAEAFASQLSVIQGPPGTGKTQTILNIIANIIMQGKTVMVVSNNNSATANVKEKLQKYGMDFIVASLGSRENKEAFIKDLPLIPTEVTSWALDFKERFRLERRMKDVLNQVDTVFVKQEKLANLRLELQSLKLEQEHFMKEHASEIATDIVNSLSSSSLMSWWMKYQAIADKETDKKTGFLATLWDKISWWWMCHKLRGIINMNAIDKNNLWPLIIQIQELYYQTRIREVLQEIDTIESDLKTINAKALVDELSNGSMLLFKDALAKKYKDVPPIEFGDVKDISSQKDDFCTRFPIVLSTTFSARTSVHEQVYDYLIMDEASQVAIETGALALTCAKNAVIVGDTMQLPNVVTEEDILKLNAIFDTYKVNEGYNSADNSFLESICKIVPGVKQTLLREHYRCHPRIINFCNQKYYGGNLLIMTHDNDEVDVLSAIKCAPGHHARGHYNQREIDVIKQEVLPVIANTEDVGIISPYNAQVDAINAQLGGNMAATVHKYQGREKDAIIFSVVDDEITEFSDDANLLDVAISRAKKNFRLVVTGNEQPHKGNITDLIDYIEYNNCQVTESKIHSIFDYLYSAYTEQRLQLLANNKKVSEYDSENLTYALIDKILKEHSNFNSLGVLCHYPMRLLISDTSAMTDEERIYASRSGTHLDFLIYSHVTKKPVLAIETDGFSFHNAHAEQHGRDIKKDNILKKYGVALLRLSTIGSNEKQKIIEALHKAALLYP